MGVSVRQKDGNWYIFVRHHGERVAQKFEKEEEATLVAQAVRHAIALGQFDIAALKKREEAKPKASIPALREYYEKTIQPLWEGSLSRNTYKSYDGSFRVHILPELGDIPVNEITRDQIKKLVTGLRKKPITVAHRKKAEDGEASIIDVTSRKDKPRLLSKETIRNIVAALRAAFTEAVESNVVVANPAVRLGKFYKEASQFREEIDPFTADEVTKLLQTTKDHFSFDNYVLLLTLFHCGLRAGEAAGLYWSDLDVKNKLLFVRRQFTRGKEGKPKTRKKRAVDVSTVLLAELQALKKTRQTEYLAAGKNEIPELIFLGPGQIEWSEGDQGKKIQVGRKDRNHVDMDNFRNRVFWKACDKAKIRRRRLHDTRHSFASLLLSNGEPLKYVSAQLGHSSIRMTADVYGHLEIGSNRAAMDRLPSLVCTSGAS